MEPVSVAHRKDQPANGDLRFRVCRANGLHHAPSLRLAEDVHLQPPLVKYGLVGVLTPLLRADGSVS
jgi:hypothetical protein